VVVPEVTGKPVVEAEDELEDAGLMAEREDVALAQEPGTVTDQDPDAGTSVEKGTTVTLSVTQAEVLEVRGQDEVDARSSLEGQGFVVDTQSETVTDPSQHGKVIRQMPEAGAIAPYGETVTLTVGEFSTAGP
jgi:eukaryotic-like serine/threonine-protein kinase